MNIYTPIIPTYLYIKQHSITKKKYFGKTIRDPYTYKGSGKHWIRHYKKHGKEFIETLWVSELYTDTKISEDALKISQENNIVESTEWLNLIPENGLDGRSVISEQEKLDTSNRMSKNNPMTILRTNSGSFKKGQSTPKTQAHKDKLSKSKLGNKNPNYGNPLSGSHFKKTKKCLYCDCVTTIGNIGRWHNDNCKLKPTST